jgi:hypothetical protein
VARYGLKTFDPVVASTDTQIAFPVPVIVRNENHSHHGYLVKFTSDLEFHYCIRDEAPLVHQFFVHTLEAFITRQVAFTGWCWPEEALYKHLLVSHSQALPAIPPSPLSPTPPLSSPVPITPHARRSQRPKDWRHDVAAGFIHVVLEKSKFALCPTVVLQPPEFQTGEEGNRPAHCEHLG